MSTQAGIKKIWNVLSLRRSPIPDLIDVETLPPPLPPRDERGEPIITHHSKHSRNSSVSSSVDQVDQICILCLSLSSFFYGTVFLLSCRDFINHFCFIVILISCVTANRYAVSIEVLMPLRNLVICPLPTCRKRRFLFLIIFCWWSS